MRDCIAGVAHAEVHRQERENNAPASCGTCKGCRSRQSEARWDRYRHFAIRARHDKEIVPSWYFTAALFGALVFVWWLVFLLCSNFHLTAAEAREIPWVKDALASADIDINTNTITTNTCGQNSPVIEDESQTVAIEIDDETPGGDSTSENKMVTSTITGLINVAVEEDGMYTERIITTTMTFVTEEDPYTPVEVTSAIPDTTEADDMSVASEPNETADHWNFNVKSWWQSLKNPGHAPTLAPSTGSSSDKSWDWEAEKSKLFDPSIFSTGKFFDDTIDWSSANSRMSEAWCGKSTSTAPATVTVTVTKP